MLERRTLLGSLAALLATPLLFGRDLVSGLFRRTAAPEGRPTLTPPSHSVKRRG